MPLPADSPDVETEDDPAVPAPDAVPGDPDVETDDENPDVRKLPGEGGAGS